MGINQVSEHSESVEEKSFPLYHLATGDTVEVQTLNNLYKFEVQDTNVEPGEKALVLEGGQNFLYLNENTKIILGKNLQIFLGITTPILSVSSCSKIKGEFDLTKTTKGGVFNYNTEFERESGKSETRNHSITMTVDANEHGAYNGDSNGTDIRLFNISDQSIRYSYDGYQGEPTVKDLEISSAEYIKAINLSPEEEAVLRNRVKAKKSLMEKK